MDIQKVMLGVSDAGSNEYKEGWNSAVSFIFDNHNVTKRNGEPIELVFEANINEDDLIKLIEESKK